MANNCNHGLPAGCCKVCAADKLAGQLAPFRVGDFLITPLDGPVDWPEVVDADDYDPEYDGGGVTLSGCCRHRELEAECVECGV